ncbi:glycosyltransferase [Synechococcus lacustris]|uniref:glycosyltransferase family 2 protein n=1 Tax=Synechococcus lacustris TaxID=2116544 RepID=UPI0020CCA94E|nr:glycosyltransferase [Synechococcus lacustris]MCP9923344.1 glycosyltransferase family 2 protein [Synechococcus lacustris Cruz CV12-2]
MKDRPKPARWWNKCKQPKRVLAERLVPKLEHWRGEIWADLLRYCLIRLQPGLRATKAANADFCLLLPPDWQITASQQKRLKRLLSARQHWSNALVVSCDDWLPQANGKRAWRQKGLLDPFLDGAIGAAEGPLWLSNAVLQQLGPAPKTAPERIQWRSQLMACVGAQKWAHVPLPLVQAPLPSLKPQLLSPKGNPLVSVLIPSGGFSKPIKGHSSLLLRHCLHALLSRSSYRNLEIVVIDAGELNQELLVELEALTTAELGPGRWRHERSQNPYSYSERINQAAAIAKGEWLMQLNDDTELLEPDSIASMLELAQRPGVGVVGALLLYPDGRVQHAGVAIDNLAPRHAWASCKPERLPPGLLETARAFQAVTAAVCLCSANLWRQLGGLRLELPINYGDVDFCLRARQAGKVVLLDPASRWIHFESASRSLDLVPPELGLFQELWAKQLGGIWCTDPYVSRWRQLLAEKN